MHVLTIPASKRIPHSICCPSTHNLLSPQSLLLLPITSIPLLDLLHVQHEIHLKQTNNNQSNNTQLSDNPLTMRTE
jgi:hypothetical protein